jgi:hypothetical protein
MKKEIQSKNKNINMTQKSVPKRIQNILSALIEFVVDTVGDNDDTIRRAMIDNQDELIKLLKDNTHVQNNNSKKIKDPDAPKRGKSSYIYFCVEKRESIKKANPDMSAKDIIKELGRVWREKVNDEDKSRYTKLSTDDKIRYENEMKDYTPPQGMKKNEKIVGPKRALTSYIFFCKNQRSILKDENSQLSTNDITSLLAKRWRELSEKDRQPYTKLAEKDKVRYEEEKALLVSTNSETSTKKTRRKSGYILFCQETRSEVKKDNEDFSSQQITKELGSNWKKLGDDEKDVYNKRANSKSPKSSKKKLPEPPSDSEELESSSEEDSS